MGTRNRDGKAYPSTGMAVVFIVAHELGHNFGMHHDGSELDEKFYKCKREGGILSPTRGAS